MHAIVGGERDVRGGGTENRRLLLEAFETRVMRGCLDDT